MTQTQQKNVPISRNGRINLPADMRRALGLSGAGHVIVTLADNEIRITTARQALKNIRDLAAPYRPTDGLVSEQLIAERREEVAREQINEGDTLDD